MLSEFEQCHLQKCLLVIRRNQQVLHMQALVSSCPSQVKKKREAWILSCSREKCTQHINLLSFDMLCSACYDNLVTYLNKFLHQKADVCLNKTQISTLLAVLQIHDTSNTRTGREVLLDKFLSPEPSLWKFFTDFDRLCFFFVFLSSVWECQQQQQPWVTTQLSLEENYASSPSISSGFPDNLLVFTIHQRQRGTLCIPCLSIQSRKIMFT